MKIVSSWPGRKSRFVMTLGVAFVFFACCGCAHLATVKTIRPPMPTALGNEEQRARDYLIAAEHQPPLAALGNDLLAARLSLKLVEEHPGDSSAQSIYNFSVARVVENIARARLQPWRRAVQLGANQENFRLTTVKAIDAEHDPDLYNLFPTDTLKISGTFFKTSSTVEGMGAPIVVVGRAETTDFRQKYKYHRVYAPITSVIRFSRPGQAQLEFVDPLKTDRATVNRRTFPLSADFSAPTALLIARERPERLGASRVFNPEAYANTTMLCQLQQYDPARTPVIFVHGLQETGASWAPMIDALRRDPVIRKRYQFWFFSYPSGYPYPYSAALFRRELDGIDRAFPKHKRVVLIGHSMGGMVCRLMITDSGDKIWRDFFATPPNKTPLPNDTLKIAEDGLIFRHRPEVQRTIFISTPHRGSDLATSLIGRIGAGLVKTPQPFTSFYASIKPLLIADPAARPLKRMPNSVDTLEPNDRFVETVNKIPITPGISYHSIMGDRGRGDTPNSSDGIVPYWSSHLDGAQSELIVNSGHGAQYNVQAIREVERILKENPTAKN